MLSNISNYEIIFIYEQILVLIETFGEYLMAEKMIVVRYAFLKMISLYRRDSECFSRATTFMKIS